MTEGFWQMPLDISSVRLTEFVTTHGHFQRKYMASGLKNTTASSSFVEEVVCWIGVILRSYPGDVIIFSVPWYKHLEQLRQVLHKIAYAGLPLNLKKIVFANAEIDFLGYHYASFSESGGVVEISTA